MDGLVFYEKPFALLGLDTPALRFLVTTSVITGAILYAKPEFAFMKDGSPKYFRPVMPKHKYPKEYSTYVAWWIPGILAGVVAGIFI